MGLRKPINDMCKECIYDKHAAGSWRQQVELCSCQTCPLWDVRPKSSGESIPESVLAYYAVKSGDLQA